MSESKHSIAMREAHERWRQTVGQRDDDDFITRWTNHIAFRLWWIVGGTWYPR